MDSICAGSGAGKLNRLQPSSFFLLLLTLFVLWCAKLNRLRSLFLYHLLYFICAGSGAGKLNRLRPSASTLRVSSIFKRQAAIMQAPPPSCGAATLSPSRSQPKRAAHRGSVVRRRLPLPPAVSALIEPWSLNRALIAPNCLSRACVAPR